MSAINQDMSQDTLDAIEMINYDGIPVQGVLKGFTPMFDTIAEKDGIVRAAVFGKAWRHCQLKDKVCRASLETLSSGLGIDRATVQRHLDALCADGYLIDKTPHLKNRPHVYKDTGKVRIEVNIDVAESNSDIKQEAVHVAQSNVEPIHVAQNNSHVAQDHSHVAQDHMSIDLKKDLKRDSANAQTYRQNVANRLSVGIGDNTKLVQALETLTGRKYDRPNKTDALNIADLKEWKVSPSQVMHFAHYWQVKNAWQKTLSKPTLKDVRDMWDTAMAWQPANGPARVIETPAEANARILAERSQF